MNMHGGSDGKKREQTCILLSRVPAYMMGFNIEKVRSHGNITGADLLEQKLTEWADALHDYETLGVAINHNHVRIQEGLRKQRNSFAHMLGVKNRTTVPEDRKALNCIVKKMADELGIPYQPDILDQEDQQG